MRGNKLFVQSMIVTAIVGLVILMLTMFIGIRWVLDKDTGVETEQEQLKVEKPTVAFNSTIKGVIKALDDEVISVFDMEKKQSVRVTVEKETQIKDAYDKPMPQEMLKVGDVVELVYEPKNQKLLSIGHYMQGWVKTDMKYVKLDKSNRTLTIGENIYNYTDYTVILDKEGQAISIYQVGDQDVLELRGVKDEVYSIKVVEEQGYLELENIPTNEGVVEIDRNRQLPIGSITAPIPVTAGEHKIGIQLRGYEPFIQEVSIEAGETLTWDLSKLERAYSTLTLQLQNASIPYTVKVNKDAYTKDQEIKVPVGTYTVEIMAEGYHPWKQEIALTEPLMNLAVVLEAIKTEEPKPEVPKEEPNTGTSGENNNGNKVNLDTEPGNAKIAINGVAKGNTPYATHLDLGEYTIRFEKEGYEPYETSIIIDNANAQNNYLYMLIPKADE